MNKYLLAGASVLAILGAGSAANAQFTLVTSGDLWVDFGYTDSEPPRSIASDSRQFEALQRGRVNFIWTQKSDNGLTYGARYRVRLGPGPGNGLDYDKAFIFVNGTFGQVSLGVNSGLADQWGATASAWGTGGADGNYNDFIYRGQGQTAATAALYENPAGRAFGIYGELANDNRTRLWYISPSFAGVSAGVSYLPVQGGGGSNALGRGFEFDKNVATFNDVIQAGLNYDNTFGAARVRAFGTYSFGEGRPGGTSNGLAVTQTEDLAAFALQLRVDVGPFAVSAHYVNNGESGQSSTAAFREDAQNWGLLAQYTVLPQLTVGASYAYYEDAGDPGIAGRDELTVYSIGLAYTVAPGLSLRPEYHYFDFKNEGAQRDENGNIFMVRTQVTF